MFAHILYQPMFLSGFVFNLNISMVVRLNEFYSGGKKQQFLELVGGSGCVSIHYSLLSLLRCDSISSPPAAGRLEGGRKKVSSKRDNIRMSERFAFH